jgi:Kef-type K+ transport system membrane component KefB
VSSAAASGRGASARIIQALGLTIISGLFYAVVKATPNASTALEPVAAVGFFLMGGTLLSELLEPLGIPHLTGYLAVGILSGPSVLHLIDHETVESLGSVNDLALALIALSGGAELRIELIRKGLRSLVTATVIQHVMTVVLMTGIFMFAGRLGTDANPLLPFAHALPLSALFGVGLLWGVVAATRSPSATLGILAQTRAKGPLANFMLSFVMTSDVVVIVLAAAAMTIAKTLVEPGASLSGDAFGKLGHEILGSVSLGTTLGLVIIAYLKFVNRQFLVVLLALGVGFTQVIKYLDFEPLLTFLVAGFLVQNLSKEGDRFLHAIEDTGSVVYVVFFARAGAHIDLPLLKTMWKVAALLFVCRFSVSVLGNAISTRLAKDPPVLRRWGWSGLISQAGVAIGLATLISNAFPSFGAGFRALAFASVALNEMIGPILFKTAIDRSGETSSAPEKSRRAEELG